MKLKPLKIKQNYCHYIYYNPITFNHYNIKRVDKILIKSNKKFIETKVYNLFYDIKYVRYMGSTTEVVMAYILVRIEELNLRINLIDLINSGSEIWLVDENESEIEKNDSVVSTIKQMHNDKPKNEECLKNKSLTKENNSETNKEENDTEEIINNIKETIGEELNKHNYLLKILINTINNK